MAVVEVSIVPLGSSSPSVSKYVKKALEVLRKEKIKFSLSAMGTILEDKSLDKVLKVVVKMHRAVLDGKEVKRVVTSIRVDERVDKHLSIEGKLKAVKND